jgi:aspartate/methionine/tyrosine aminotransferase
MTVRRPSEIAMDRFVRSAPGLRAPHVARPDPTLPTLPDLKKLAQDRRSAGLAVIDQSAGDIDDVGQPLAPEFGAWIEHSRDTLVTNGARAFRRTAGDAYGFPANYTQQYPVVLEALVASWGIQSTPTRSVQTLSGRAALDFAFRGLLARAKAAGLSGPPALILDPLAWSGYGTLARDLGLTLVNGPAVGGHGLSNTADGLAEAIAFAKAQGLAPVGVIPILPSNPTGVGMASDELRRFVEVAAAADIPVLIDGFYSPLHPDGHAAAVPMGELERTLSPEALGMLGLIIGETKVTSSQNKTGSLIWMAPTGHDAVAKTVVGAAVGRMKTTNCYPRPQEALVAYALHTFPGGVQAAMGPRYAALDATRKAMTASCDALGLPLSIGGSFYGTVALVDAEGRGLVRDAEGRPLTGAREVSELLIERFGLVGAPGGMFSSAPEANLMVRMTAAVTLEDVQKVDEILRRMLDDAQRLG